MELNEIVRQAIESCGSARALAQRLDVSDAYVSQMRKGKKIPSASMAAELAEIVGANPALAILESEELNAKPEHKDVMRRAREWAIAASLNTAAAMVLAIGLQPNSAQAAVQDNNEHSIPYAQSMLPDASESGHGHDGHATVPYQDSHTRKIIRYP